VAVGAAVELAVYSSNPCVAEISTLVVSVYKVFYYLSLYISTGSSDSLAFGLTYLIEIFQTSFTFNCGTSTFSGKYFFDEEPATIDDYIKGRLQSELQVMQTSDLTDLINTLTALLGEVEYVLSILYIVLDS